MILKHSSSSARLLLEGKALMLPWQIQDWQYQHSQESLQGPLQSLSVFARPSRPENRSQNGALILQGASVFRSISRAAAIYEITLMHLNNQPESTHSPKCRLWALKKR